MTPMTDEQKKKLEQKLWDIANTLRGKMNADEFRDYILGFIFYKYLSERLYIYANSILTADDIDFADVDETTDDGKAILDAVAEAAVDELGYFLKPSELFSAVAKRGSKPGNFIIEDLARILNNIERSTMGTESEDDFDDLFSDMDFTSNKLGRTEEAKNTLIAKVLTQLDQIDFELDKIDSDVLGDAYEYPRIYHQGTQLAGRGDRPACEYLLRHVHSHLYSGVKKCREHPEDILFVDAYTCFEKGKNQNYLRPQDIANIVDT